MNAFFFIWTKLKQYVNYKLHADDADIKYNF